MRINLLYLVQLASGQVRTAEVLATARNDLRVRQSDDLQRTAAALRFHQPLLKEVEARVGIRGSVLGDTIYGYLRNEDLYALQITANSLRVRKSQMAYKDAQAGAYSAEKQVFLEEALQMRYEALVDWHYVRMLSETYRQLSGLLSKKQELLRLSAEKGLDVRVKDIVDTEDDRIKTTDKLLEMQQQSHLSEARIRQYLGVQDAVTLDTSDFISPRKIGQSHLMLPVDAATHPEISYRRQLSNLAEARADYANAQNHQVLNSLRINYEDPLYLQRPNRFNTFNNFAIRLGLTIPLPANNNYQSSRATLDWREAQLSEQRATQDFESESALQRTQLQHLLESYEHCRLQEEQSLIPALLSNPTLRTALSPMELTDLEITRQQLGIRTLEAARELTLSYIQLLYLHGLLSQEPHTNWLSEKGEGW